MIYFGQILGLSNFNVLTSLSKCIGEFRVGETGELWDTGKQCGENWDKGHTESF